MPARFCPQCGTPAARNARFCIECGTPLEGPRPPDRGGWQLTAAGSAVLGFFLIAGLAVWTAILSPSPPKPGPGGGAPRAAAASASGQLPEGHPKVPIPLPPEAKEFIADLAAKTKEKPDDVAAWAKLGQVYYRAAQLDEAYFPQAQAAFRRVLELDPKNADALRGMANVHYDRDQYKEAITYYERYLELSPGDLGARTDLGTMYLSGGDATRALATYQDVLKRDPSFMQAHFNLAILYHQQGDDAAALAELKRTRGLATDEGVRRQIDDMIAALSGTPPPAAPPAQAASAPSAFQGAVEQALREHPIMGPKIVRFEWSGPATGRVLVQSFPMDAMPPAVREKFTARLAVEMRQARTANAVEGPIRLEIADASSGAVMATVTP